MFNPKQVMFPVLLKLNGPELVVVVAVPQLVGTDADRIHHRSQHLSILKRAIHVLRPLLAPDTSHNSLEQSPQTAEHSCSPYSYLMPSIHSTNALIRSNRSFCPLIHPLDVLDMKVFVIFLEVRVHIHLDEQGKSRQDQEDNATNDYKDNRHYFSSIGSLPLAVSVLLRIATAES
jgi:hypothetical protein